MKNASANNMWGDYLKNHLEDVFHETPKIIHFYDNEFAANESAKLVKNGIKRATSDSLLRLQQSEEKHAKIGDFTIVTNWEGEAQCIIETTKVKLKPFFSIDEEYAKLEAEGDKSLTHWKKVYWDYFTRELAKFGRKPSESMIVVCQEFVKVYP